MITIQIGCEVSISECPIGRRRGVCDPTIYVWDQMEKRKVLQAEKGSIWLGASHSSLKQKKRLFSDSAARFFKMFYWAWSPWQDQNCCWSVIYMSICWWPASYRKWSQINRGVQGEYEVWIWYDKLGNTKPFPWHGICDYKAWYCAASKEVCDWGAMVATQQ